MFRAVLLESDRLGAGGGKAVVFFNDLPPAHTWHVVAHVIPRCTLNSMPAMKTRLALLLILLVGSTLALAAGTPRGDRERCLRARLETSAGNIIVRLDHRLAPRSVENFVDYAQSGYYDGTIFHRVINGFMLQGGGHLPDLVRKPELFPPVINEASNGLRNQAMSVAFARGDDPHSALAQFYINQVDNDYLNYSPGKSAGYTVFGQVVEGQQVVHRIAATPTHAIGELTDLPKQTVLIERVVILQ